MSEHQWRSKRTSSRFSGPGEEGPSSTFRTSQVHHHHHYKPKDQKEKFAWLDYQYDRKYSTMQRKTQKNNPDNDSSWADLTQNTTTKWYQMNWTFDNIMYKLESVKDFFSTKNLLTYVGLRANEVNIKMYGSHKAVYVQNLKIAKAMQDQNVILIHPLSRVRLFLDFTTTVLLVLTCILTPLELSFGPPNEMFCMILAIFGDLWFILDILCNFRTCVMTDDNCQNCSVDLQDIKYQYLTKWFSIDLLSTVPMELFFKLPYVPILAANMLPESRFSLFLLEVSHGMLTTMGFENKDSSSLLGNTSMLKALKITKLLRILKLLRIFRLIRTIKFWEEMYENNFETIVFITKTLKGILQMVFFCHLSACTIYGFATSDLFTGGGGEERSGKLEIPLHGSWLEHHPNITIKEVQQINNDSEIYWRIYAWSLFKALSHMFCIGYGVNSPKTRVDVLVCMSSIFLGAAIFAMVVATIISAMQSYHACDSIYKEKINQVKAYMKYRDIPFDLQERVFMYYEYRFQGKVFNEDHVLSELNPVLEKTVKHYNQKWLIESAPMFEDTSENFRDAITEALTFQLYLQDDILFAENDRATEVFFLSRGTVNIECQGEIVGRKIDGEYIGELAMVCPQIDRLATAICDTCCYVYELNLSCYRTICKKYPQDYIEVLKYAQYRLTDEHCYYQGLESDYLQFLNHTEQQAQSSMADKDSSGGLTGRTNSLINNSVSSSAFKIFSFKNSMLETKPSKIGPVADHGRKPEKIREERSSRKSSKSSSRQSRRFSVNRTSTDSERRSHIQRMALSRTSRMDARLTRWQAKQGKHKNDFRGSNS